MLGLLIRVQVFFQPVGDNAFAHVLQEPLVRAGMEATAADVVLMVMVVNAQQVSTTMAAHTTAALVRKERQSMHSRVHVIPQSFESPQVS
jgi:hypothetical protein